MNLFDLSGKRIAVTGARGGIGQALVQGFWDAGAVVLPVSRRGAEDWKETPAAGRERWLPLACDLADIEAVRSLPGAMLAATGDSLDVLVNNASICPPAPGDPYDGALRDEVFAVDFTAPYELCARLAPVMAAARGGSIINVTTMNAERAWPGNPAYVTAKAALRLLTKSVGRDFGARGVRANNLCPGYVATRMTAASRSDPVRFEERRSRTMLGRWGEPADMVGPALFLASDASRYVTGIDLHVDGGWSAMGL